MKLSILKFEGEEGLMILPMLKINKKLHLDSCYPFVSRYEVCLSIYIYIWTISFKNVRKDISCFYTKTYYHSKRWIKKYSSINHIVVRFHDYLTYINASSVMVKLYPKNS